MAGQRALASYWNGSAWVDIVNPSTTDSAIISLDIQDTIHTPTVAHIRIINNASTAGAVGPFSSTFSDFTPIRILDRESHLVYFYGLIYNLVESYDKIYGMIIDIECRDSLQELKDNSTVGLAGYKIDATASLSAYVSNKSQGNIDDETNLHNTVVASRGGIIKSLIYGITEGNITFTGDVKRFVDSVAAYEQDDFYKLGNENQKSVLSHIYMLSQTDPQLVFATDGEAVYGHDYYADPNFQSPAADHKPTAFFNYFVKGTRPNASSNPTTYGLRIHIPSESGFAESTRMVPMQEWEFDRPRNEIFTDALVRYAASDINEDGETEEVEVHSTFEILKVQAVANQTLSATASVPRWKGLPIASTHTGFNEDDGVLYPEWMQVKITDGVYNTSGTLTTIARMQYINKISSVSDNAPAYVLISDVDESIDSSCFADDVIWYGKTNTSASITIKSRPRTTYGVKRTLNMTLADTNKSNTIRQNIVAALLRKSNQIIRGSFKTYRRPDFAFDNTPSSVTGLTGNTQVITLDSLNPFNYGFHIGMAVVQLVNGVVPNSGVVYGYAYGVTSTTVSITWNTTTAATTSTSLRYSVPVRAGDLIDVKNTLANIDGNFLVTSTNYTEQPGVFNTTYEVVGMETNFEGGYNRKSFASTVADAIGTNYNIPQSKPNSGNIGNSKTTCVFTSTTTNQVNWATGNLIIGNRTYTISASNTSTTMITSGNGNTGQSGGTLASATDYYIYYPGSGTQLKTVRKAAYRNVAPDEVAPIVIGWCKAGSVEAEFSIWVQQFDMGITKGDAAKKLTKHSLTSVLAKKGMLGWTTNTVFSATGTTGEYNKIKFGLKGTIANNSAVSFSDDETVEDVLSSNNVTWGNGNSSSESGGKITLAAGSNYFFKTVGANATANQTLQVTGTYSSASSDDKILMAIVVVAASGDGSSSPSIFPFNGNEATISAGVISAGAIVASNIQANVITTGELNFTPSQPSDAKTAGSVGGWTLSSDAMYVSNKQTSDGFQTNGFTIAANGSIHATNFFINDDGDAGFKGAITASTITGGTIVGATISTAAAQDEGIVLNSSIMKIYNSGDSLGSGERIQIYDSAGTSRLRIRAFSSRDFGLNHVLDTAGWMLSHSGSVSGTSTSYGVYPQGQFYKSHLGYIFNGYDEALWGTTNAPTTDKVFGWGGLILAGAVSDNAASTRYLHLLHGGTANYKIVFPDGLPSNGKILAVKASGYANGIANLEWATAGSGTINSGTQFRGTYYATTGTTLTATGYYMSNAQVGSTAIPVTTVATQQFFASSSTVKFTGVGSTWGGLYASISSVDGTLTAYSSSRRYKENIENLAVDTSKVFDLTPRQFKYKDTQEVIHFEEDDPDPEETITKVGPNSFGFIAEEVYEHIPELVALNKDGEPEGVNYPLVSILLLEEVKKLKARIEVLEG